ncbi:MAG TPA: class I SAM-dependent methyltransferase [Chitinophagaceae bacterium]
MYSRFQLARKYLQYYITASNGRGHGIHSPFVFDFITRVLNDGHRYDAYARVEGVRAALEKDPRVLEVDDFGAGSVTEQKKARSITDITRTAVKPKKYGQLLFRMAAYYKPHYVLELGTSVGLTTAYLALADGQSIVTTVEGSPAIAELARENFRKLDLSSIALYNRPFDECLPRIIQHHPHLDFVFIDGNHRMEPTLDYFNQLLPAMDESSVIVFDDIHWSRDMETAWEKIKHHPEVMLTIDLFFIGLVFFRKEFKVKQDFTIRF